MYINITLTKSNIYTHIYSLERFTLLLIQIRHTITLVPTATHRMHVHVTTPTTTPTDIPAIVPDLLPSGKYQTIQNSKDF